MIKAPSLFPIRMIDLSSEIVPEETSSERKLSIASASSLTNELPKEDEYNNALLPTINNFDPSLLKARDFTGS